MKRVFANDVLVRACGGAMRFLVVLPDGDASPAILQHLELPTEPPDPRALAPPHGWLDDA
jgi:hypothetical protein